VQFLKGIDENVANADNTYISELIKGKISKIRDSGAKSHGKYNVFKNPNIE
jgi:hypothetical protein